MPNLLSSFLQKQRFKAAVPFLDGDILDLGCGQGKLINLLRPEQSYTGVERTPRFIEYLITHYPDRSFQLLDLNQDRLDLGRQFDTILMLAVLEHLKDPLKILSQIPVHLKPSGKLIITTPTILGDRIHQAGARLGLFALSAVEEHEHIYTFQAINNLLQQSGLTISKFRLFQLGCNQLYVCQKQSS